ncbi:fimbria/pilus chaperone family protein [Pseudomonas libanensis]|nr:fimbria/pilus chaperone family protein [Pseudomonas libanensis]
MTYLLFEQIKDTSTINVLARQTIGSIMKTCFKFPLSFTALLFPVLMLGFAQAHASGMSPDRTVLLIDEGQGEATINVTNTDKGPSLLVSAVYNLDSDNEDIIVVSPPMARVEAGDTQSVRFILEQKEPSTVQRLRRATFEGIPPNSDSGSSKVGMTLMHDMPVIISPKGLKKDLTPWKNLTWTSAPGKLVVKNPSPYVIRLLPVVELLPGDQTVTLPNTYILPGQTLSLDLPKDQRTVATHIKIKPANLHGYAADPFSAPIE